ncbi:MAG TPA: thiolase family protein [Deltaproteobacteria bacterium]|nr:thiolase family protein [Deltaproteobacteria bacterium]
MAQKVGIVAVAQSKYSGARTDVSQKELAHETVSEVLEAGGLTLDSKTPPIDQSVIVCDEFWEAQTLSEVKYGDVTGAHMRDGTRCTQDGATAVHYATNAILSGHLEVILIMAICKESRIRSRNIITNYGYDPFICKPLGMDDTISAALQARIYMDKYGITREDCAKVVVKNRANAAANPYAQLRQPVSEKEVLGSAMLASPISALDMYPVSDGACALIMANEEWTRRLTDKPVWVTGVGVCRDTYNLGTRDLSGCAALEAAAQAAYAMAGIKKPAEALDVVELSGHYSYQELLYSEGLGLCPRGEGHKLLESGKTEKNGTLPINPSGGVLAGVPVLVAGASRVIEAALQLRGEAGQRQVKHAKTAVAHGMFGPCGQLQCVITLSAD